MNDQFIEILQIEWYMANTQICFRLGHNQHIASADLLQDKIQCTDTVIVVWIGETIPVQETLEAIKQTLIESKEFQRYDIDQVELLNKIIILKPGK